VYLLLSPRVPSPPLSFSVIRSVSLHLLSHCILATRICGSIVRYKLLIVRVVQRKWLIVESRCTSHNFWCARVGPLGSHLLSFSAIHSVPLRQLSRFILATRICGSIVRYELLIVWVVRRQWLIVGSGHNTLLFFGLADLQFDRQIRAAHSPSQFQPTLVN
jgi:hypothetical protein